MKTDPAILAKLLAQDIVMAKILALLAEQHPDSAAFLNAAETGSTGKEISDAPEQFANLVRKNIATIFELARNKNGA